MLEAVFEEARATAKAALVKRGAALAEQHVLPRVGRGLAALDAGPTFSSGATAVIGGTCAVLGAWAGWELHEFFKKRTRR